MEESQTAVVSSTINVDVIEPVTVEQIIEAHKEASKSMFDLVNLASSWIQKAAHCGRLLAAKKAELGHGNFLPWLAANVGSLGFAYDTANDYMKAARYLDKNPNLEKPLNTVWVQNLRQVAGMLEDKPLADKEEREKPAFVIRCVFNTEPDKLDEVQRCTAFDQAKPMLSVFEAFGFIEIKV